jgi:hypothetical protein
MFDFDPRDYDSRDDEQRANTPGRDGRSAVWHVGQCEAM